MKNNQKHLPVMGVGPIYVMVIIFITLLGIILQLTHCIHITNFFITKIPFIILGIVLIVIGCIFWVSAVFQSHLDENIKNNHLVTTGIYAYVRNPIYTAFIFICTGVLLFMNNLWLLILPIIYWLFLTVFMKMTEEKWLRNLYGEEYLEYCQRVNRCIPWFKNEENKNETIEK